MTFFSDGRFTLCELTSSMVSFLESYMPKDRHFTSAEEIAKVSEELMLNSLKGMTEELRAVRNSVVKFYSDKMEDCDSETRWNLSTSMMSVTAVIDSVMYGC